MDDIKQLYCAQSQSLVYLTTGSQGRSPDKTKSCFDAEEQVVVRRSVHKVVAYSEGIRGP